MSMYLPPDPTALASQTAQTVRPQLGLRFMLAHPAHVLALGFGCGLGPKAPGTVGTLWAWLLFVLLDRYVSQRQWPLLLLLALALGWWACALTARHLQRPDPGAIVWDEVAAFWLVLWLASPMGWQAQLAAFVLFRFFDVVKIGPVAWADRLFHAADSSVDRHAWCKCGFGIMLDDLVAAFCTLFVLALWRVWA